ncbi:MAG: hypothetical protein U0O22_01710 [Acutalibacteraceae bacterium]|nr:hypothetical protein [Acutalibacteraceae bacterium]
MNKRKAKTSKKKNNKNCSKYCDCKVKIVQIDIEKEFYQMVENYNQFPKNTSINPLEIETVDNPIRVMEC